MAPRLLCRIHVSSTEQRDGPRIARSHSARNLGVPRYWIVVERGNSELRQILEIAFDRRAAFAVVEDRRVSGRPVAREPERRHGAESLRLHGFFVAERQE